MAGENRLSISEVGRIDFIKRAVIAKINRSSDDDARKKVLIDSVERSYSIEFLRKFLDEDERNAVNERVWGGIMDKLVHRYGESGAEKIVNDMESDDKETPEETVVIEDNSSEQSILAFVDGDGDDDELTQALYEQLDEAEELAEEEEFVEDCMDDYYTDVDAVDDVDENREETEEEEEESIELEDYFGSSTEDEIEGDENIINDDEEDVDELLFEYSDIEDESMDDIANSLNEQGGGEGLDEESLEESEEADSIDNYYDNADEDGELESDVEDDEEEEDLDEYLASLEDADSEAGEDIEGEEEDELDNYFGDSEDMEIDPDAGYGGSKEDSIDSYYERLDEEDNEDDNLDIVTDEESSEDELDNYFGFDDEAESLEGDEESAESEEDMLDNYFGDSEEFDEAVKAGSDAAESTYEDELDNYFSSNTDSFGRIETKPAPKVIPIAGQNTGSEASGEFRDNRANKIFSVAGRLFDKLVNRPGGSK